MDKPKSILCLKFKDGKPRVRVEAKGLKVHMCYTFECQYAKPINTAWNGSLPQANAGDILIAAPLV